MTKVPGKKPSNTLRIIGGEWRHRKITFCDGPGLRPTQDRIRETLFNWLMFEVEGAVCLDMFAGSGALGFEALSRGARHVTFVDSSPKVLQTIQQNADVLKASRFDLVLGTCPQHVPPLSNAPFDIAFLDAPFHQGLINPTVAWLQQSGYLNPDAWIYFEIEKGGPPLQTPQEWIQHRHKETASLDYYLYKSQD